MGMQITHDVRIVYARCQNGNARGMLAWFLNLHRLAMMMKLVEGLIQVAIRPSGEPSIGQDNVQQTGRDAGDFQTEVMGQRLQTAHNAGRNGQNHLEKACFGADKNAVSGQNILIRQSIIDRQGIAFVNVKGD